LSLHNVVTDVVYVGALGASTPVGRDAWSSAAAVRAAISGFTFHPYMVDAVGEPMRVAAVPWLDIDHDGVARFEALLFPALDQVLAPLLAGKLRLRVGLGLGLPPQRPGLPNELERDLRELIARRYGSQFAVVATFPIGHAAGLLALDAACTKLAQGGLDACVIAGVDSYLAPETLEWLEDNEQLHGAGPLNNAWGFIPGEGAGAALILSQQALDSAGIDPLGRVLSVGVAVEPNRIKTETVCVGEGLTAAFREGLAGLPLGAKVTDVFTDMNGEPYRADEFGFASLRTREAFVSASDFVAPADCWGDVSAASVPLGAALATVAGRKGYASGPYALLWASSESGQRGAALIQIPFAGSS
jgi:3-oxoacyl-[acyl-carrier-protein] synthase I